MTIEISRFSFVSFSEENDVVPQVVQAILNLPENTHIAVRHTSILLLGELCEWINSHPQSLGNVSFCCAYKFSIKMLFRFDNIVFCSTGPILSFLLGCLSQKGLGSAASNALQSICTACPKHMAPQFHGLLGITQSIDNYAISNDAAIGLLKGPRVQRVSNFNTYS